MSNVICFALSSNWRAALHSIRDHPERTSAVRGEGGSQKRTKSDRGRGGPAKVDVLFTHAQKSLKANQIQISCLNGGHVQQNLFTVGLIVTTWKKKRRR